MTAPTAYRFEAAWRDACALVRKAVRDGAAPGAAVAARFGDEHREAGYGVADLRTGAALRPQSVFHIGSLSKLVTGTALLRLVEDGAVELDQPVADRVPFRFSDSAASRLMTARHFLSHSSGVASDLSSAGQADITAPDLAAYLRSCRSVQVAGPPGAAFRYCSHGWVVLARLMEVATGQPWQAVVRHRLLDALGLPIDLTGASTASEDHVAGHLRDPKTGRWVPVPPRPYPAAVAPAGGAHASPAALLALGRAHLPVDAAGAGRRILTDHTLVAMREPVIRTGASSGAWAWGLIWGLHDWQGEQVLAQGGLVFGQATLLMLHPARAAVVAVAVNCATGEELCEITARAFLGPVLGIRPPAFTGYAQE